MSCVWRPRGGCLAVDWRGFGVVEAASMETMRTVSVNQPKGQKMQMIPDAAKIKQWREERLWSQEHLADLAGIGLRTIQRIENGENASRDSVMALAAAFNVDVAALTIDPDAEAAKAARTTTEEKTAALRLSFWIHLASFAFSLLVFIAISIGDRSLVMLWPALWWAVGVAAHGLTVVIVELVTRHEREFPKT